jgi:hypothetical protein
MKLINSEHRCHCQQLGLELMKQHLLFWALTKDQCRIFYAHPSFRSQLEALVHDPSEQLRVWLNGDGITDVGTLAGVHTLSFNGCERLG